jgi:hypothetical protein
MVMTGNWRAMTVMCDVGGREQCQGEAGGCSRVRRVEGPSEGRCETPPSRRGNVVAAMEIEVHAVFKIACEPMMAG